MNKAQCIAHYIARCVRESYTYEKVTEKENGKSKTPAPKQPMDYYSMIRAAGINV